MSHLPFSTPAQLEALVEAYFVFIGGEYHLADTAGAGDNDEDIISRKIWDRDPEPATFSGLAYFLGFRSCEEFKENLQKGNFSFELNRANLRIVMAYEKKLHNNQTSAGAIYALRSKGRNEKATDTVMVGESVGMLNVNIIESGPKPAGNEHDILL